MEDRNCQTVKMIPSELKRACQSDFVQKNTEILAQLKVVRFLVGFEELFEQNCSPKFLCHVNNNHKGFANEIEP